jgi:ribosomal protein L19
MFFEIYFIVMKLFFLLTNRLKTKSAQLIKERRSRITILMLGNVLFSVGDILVVTFWKNAILYRFEGICISIRKKKLLNFNTTIILRNIIMGIGIEFTIAYYLHRIFFLTINDYKRKQLIYRKSKLYYLRCKLNRASRVK